MVDPVGVTVKDGLPEVAAIAAISPHQPVGKVVSMVASSDPGERSVTTVVVAQEGSRRTGPVVTAFLVGEMVTFADVAQTKDHAGGIRTRVRGAGVCLPLAPHTWPATSH